MGKQSLFTIIATYIHVYPNRHQARPIKVTLCHVQSTCSSEVATRRTPVTSQFLYCKLILRTNCMICFMSLRQKYVFSCDTSPHCVCHGKNVAGRLVSTSQVNWAVQTNNYKTTTMELDENIVQVLYFSHMVYID
jgi:hypothetical protein